MEGRTKHDRKITKKQHRYQSVLLNETSIQHSESPMQYMMLCNAGLVSGIQYEDVVNVFSKFGSVERVVMIPGKSYCFVIYHEVEAAKIAYEKLNGIMKLEKMDGPMYLLFCQEVPEIKSAISLGILPDGLTLIEDFVTEEEEEKLLACVHWEEMSDHFGKIMKHRRVKHYGFEFRYDNNNVDKDKPLSEKIPEECLFINKRLEEKGYGTLLPWTPDQLTVNQYQKGQGIPSHIDTHSAFESPIMSLSLGSDVVMEFKSVDEHIPVFLPRRSMLVMDGPARYAWSHGITPRTMDVISVRGGLTVQERGVRTSFTFRRVRQSECCCNYHQYCNIWCPEKVSEDIASKLEAIHVHEVYDTIALHFSDTRSKIWPNVRTFIESFAVGSILVDVGCGNGKYFGVNKNIFQVGCDHSKGLATVTYDRGNEVFICNCLQLPLRSNIADGVISIAVLHHLSTEERRFQALQEIVRVLRPGGKALIYVWAKNQSRSKMSAYLKQDRKNRRNQGDGIKDDIQNSKIKQETLVSCDTVLNNAENILNFKNLNIPENEICNDKVVNTLSKPTTVNFDKSKLSVNLPVHINRTEFQHHDLLVPWKMKSTFCKEKTEKKEDQMFLRYYHVFEEGEIDEVCSKLLNININRTYYDEGNWCIILEKVEN